ncbi:MAG: putative Zn-dependent protease [Phenylobacterium sp.]|jgi:predicted Zn-dependent protease
MNTIIRPISLALAGLSVLLSSGCAVNPASGTPDLVMMSESKELKIGKEMHEKMLKTASIYKDEKLQQYVNRIGQHIAKNSDRPELEYHFTIIDAPEINAFAFPGGYIYINRGLLAYLGSEAELAAVLSHEIGHVTARHAVRQDAAHSGSGILSLLTYLTTGSAVLADMSNLWSTVAVKGYGREMELEADSYGAGYLYNSGYDPQAMIATLGVLKDQEKFGRFRAREAGKKPRSYHGVFSTHPRNDIRLKEVIKKAGTLPKDQQNKLNEAEFRNEVEGMVYGVNYQVSNNKAEIKNPQNRYTHDKLGFTLLFPKKWQVEKGRSKIIGVPKNKSAALSLEVRKVGRSETPTEYIRKEMKIPLLKRSEDFKQYGMKGHTGLVTSTPGQPDTRVAVLFQGRRVYLITGEVSKAEKGIDYDELFMRSIRSFRPAAVKRRMPKAKTIHYVKANEHTTFAGLAKQTRIGAYAEQQLRLINGYYPRGEPKPGDWIKIVK